MKPSNILWTNYSINFWSGCKKVSPGCLHCYAEAFSKRNPKTFGQWGAGAPRNWHGERARSTLLTLNRAAEKLGTRYKIFPNSMSDWLDDEVPIEWLAHMLETIYMTPHLDYQLVTKRPENWHSRIKEAFMHLAKKVECDYAPTVNWLSAWMGTMEIEEPGMLPEPPENIWIGVTVEDKPRLARIPHLLNIPAKIRFLSCEPLLDQINILPYIGGHTYECPCGFKETESEMIYLGGTKYICRDCGSRSVMRGAVNWIVCGGESGSKANARPMQIEWARSLRDQCIAANVPFFFKQWGNYQPDDHWDGGTIYNRNANHRLLDNQEWNQMP